VSNSWVRNVSEEAWSILAAPHVWNTLMKLARELEREWTLTGNRVQEVLGGSMAMAG
jgi:hypothetical protein